MALKRVEVMKHSKKEKKRLFFISFAIVGTASLLVSSVYSDWKEITNNNNYLFLHLHN